MEERVALQTPHLRRARRQIDVKVTIAVDIAEVGTHRAKRLEKPGFLGDVRKRAIAVVAIQHLPISRVHRLASELRQDERRVATGIRDENIQIGIVIVVQKKGDKRIGDVQAHAGSLRNVGERPITVILIKHILLRVVDNVKIDVAIVIVIAPRCAKRTPGIRNACCFSYIGERAIAVVPIKHICCTITDNAVRDVDIEVTIVIVIGPSGTETTLRRAHPRFPRHIGERPIAVVSIERVVRCPRPAAACDIDIGVAVVIVIGKERTPAASRVCETSLLGDVRERSIAVIAIKRVRLICPNGEDVQIAIGIVIGPGTAAAAILFVHPVHRCDICKPRILR